MKKIAAIILAIACIAVSMTACKKGSGTGQTGISKKPEWEKVEFTDIPGDTRATLTQEEAVKKYHANTDWRIYSIRTTETTVKPSDGGTAYYVSVNGVDTNDGTSPEKAIATPGAISRLPLKAGDVVYFERGYVYRGSVTCRVAGVTYSAYGEGTKPEIYASPENAAAEGCWEATDTENIWLYHNAIGPDVGAIIFNDGEEIGTKAFIVQEGSTKRNPTTGKKFENYKDLEKNFQFFHNNGKIYLYYDGGNPSEKFDSIELNIKQNVFAVNADNITIDNICVKYTGAHGIGGGSCDGLTVTNCEIGYIGGSLQTSTTRYGNGVEIWGQATNYTVDNCYIYQVYDAGVTFQYSTKEEGDKTIEENIKFTNNVFEYCNYSIEYFLTAGDENTSYINNFEISGNQCWFAGVGLCSQRPDKTGNAHIKSWGHNNYSRGNFIVKDNLFALASNMLVETYSKNDYKATYDNNIYLQNERRKLGRNGNMNENTERFSEQQVLSITNDRNAKIITVGK